MSTHNVIAVVVIVKKYKCDGWGDDDYLSECERTQSTISPSYYYHIIVTIIILITNNNHTKKTTA